MFHIQLAEQPFTVENKFSYVKNLCSDYLTDEPGELISLSKKDIEREQTDEGQWPAAYLESLAVYRKICEKLLDRDIVLFHCSALQFRGKAYLFTAPSGTGKSTHTRLWREYFGSDVQMINDDKPLLKISPEKVTVFGTPFAGKEGLQTNTSAPVAGIVLLHQDTQNRIRRLSEEEAYPRLLSQTYRPKEQMAIVKTMELVERLAALPVYSLGCTISTKAVETAYHALIENE